MSPHELPYNKKVQPIDVGGPNLRAVEALGDNPLIPTKEVWVNTMCVETMEYEEGSDEICVITLMSGREIRVVADLNTLTNEFTDWSHLED